ncbi:MDIS1-interacting receptor like kinase 2-like [Cornus florida]|uniref:MDIS1-interacting receptor like kinase 2-like n=1 Tax=Cornus florida TaxID=4283 RepID=UPI00289EA1FB|nr:MDIS1-interacting receptor like kinase 2-like [Cornus florida]
MNFSVSSHLKLVTSPSSSILELSINQFSGAIPPDIGLLTNLEFLHLFENKLNGSIPQEIGQLKSLYELDLYMNNLDGSIPASLGSLSNLAILYLYGNELCGSIPPEMGDLSNLVELDMDTNFLMGPIPSTFKNLRKLKVLYVFNNLLSGPIPPEIVVFLLVGPFLLLGAFIGLFLVYIRRKGNAQVKQGKVQDKDVFSILSHDGRTTYDEILKATNDFDATYCIGKGGHGTVYIAELRSGNIVAVKKLHQFSEMGDVKVYEYLERGSLATNLSKDEVAQELDWHKRVNIIKGVAHALSYMHHDCSPLVVHGDISSSNVLLDSNYSQSALQPTVQVEVTPAQKRLKIIKGFSQLMPVMFEGGADPMIADDYMEQVETQLISMDVTEDHLKIIIAIYKFAKDTKLWWKSVTSRYKFIKVYSEAVERALMLEADNRDKDARREQWKQKRGAGPSSEGSSWKKNKGGSFQF